MVLSYREQGHELLSRMDCTGRPGALQGGGTGWYRAKEIQWLHGWKLRAQISVTQQLDGDGPEGLEVEGRQAARRFTSDHRALCLLVEANVVDVVFFLPDSVTMMQRAFGCADGGDVKLSWGRFRVQALLYAKPPDPQSHLRRQGRVLEFVRTRLGQEAVVLRLQDQLPPPTRLVPIPPDLR